MNVSLIPAFVELALIFKMNMCAIVPTVLPDLNVKQVNFYNSLYIRNTIFNDHILASMSFPLPTSTSFSNKIYECYF